MASPTAYQARPLRTLISIFIAWKAFLLTIALGSNFSQAYDTSTAILFEHLSVEPARLLHLIFHAPLPLDAIYFIHIAKDGYIYEQE
ncbi:unnamed protein product [Penicillium egyptiacum]|uniref:Uncharacterized protein n=1 Tax=Penicillium egyptiacum TaxID=1303716 RepID=A0A9W4K587_9EURO|nr:unnamed protein product [Penicillium egyptiacum]